MTNRFLCFNLFCLLALGLSGCDKPEADPANTVAEAPAAQAQMPSSDAAPTEQTRSVIRGAYFSVADGGILRRCDDGVELPVRANDYSRQLDDALAAQTDVYTLPVNVEGYLDGDEVWVITAVEGSGDAAQCGAPDAALIGTYWKLVNLDEGVTFPDALDNEPHIILAQDGTLKGHGGCNRLFGRYLLDGDALSFEGVAASRMACPDIDGLEFAFHNALEQTGSFRIDGNSLFLDTTSGAALAQLEAVYLQ